MLSNRKLMDKNQELISERSNGNKLDLQNDNISNNDLIRIDPKNNKISDIEAQSNNNIPIP